MKFQKMIRTQLMLAGFAGMLLLPGFARAQQEVDPTIFDVNPGTPQVSSAAAAQAAQITASATVTAAQPAAASESIEVAQVASADNLMVFGLALGSGLIAFCGMAIARRQRALRLPTAL